MLRQMDCRREIFYFPIGQSNLDGSPKIEHLSLGSKAGSADFQSTFFVLSATWQGWKETLPHRPNLSWRTDALRCQCRETRALPRGHFGGVRRFFQGPAMGHLCLLS